MIIILKIITGESIIGTIDYEIGHTADIDKYLYIDVNDPMSIDRDEEGMKLRDCLMLSTDNKLIFRASDIITYYTPSQELVNYYNKALVYSKTFTRTTTQTQINYAAEELQQAMREEDDNSNKLVQLLTKAYGGNGTIN